MIKAKWSGVSVSDNFRLMPGKGRMIANPKYKAFKDSMAWAIRIDMAGVVSPADIPFTGRVRLGLQISVPNGMDTTAIIKAACDAVQLSGAVEDDRQIEAGSWLRIGTGEGKISTIVFEIEEIV